MTAYYANPLANATVTPERIDQGVDYTGTGVYDALGAGTITQAGVGPGTGWPGHGGFVEELLSSGPLAGKTFYYAEGVDPTVKVGQKVRAGQEIATLSADQSTGTELGFGGPGTSTFAATHGGYSGSGATAAGVAASDLIHHLGGPAGVMGAPSVQGTAPGLTPAGVGAAVSTPASGSGTGGSIFSDLNPVNWIDSALSSLFNTIVSKAKYAALVFVLVVGGFMLIGKGVQRTTHAGAS